MAQGDIYQARAKFSLVDDGYAEWVWHYRQSVGTGEDYDALIALIVDMIEAAWLNIDEYLHNDTSIFEIALALWDDVAEEWNTVATETTITADGTGGTGDASPNFVAVVVKFFTDRTRSIGKKFIPGWLETAATDNALLGAPAVDAALFAADFVVTLDDGSRTYKPGNYDTETPRFSAYNEVVGVNVLMSHQDRRKLGIGIG